MILLPIRGSILNASAVSRICSSTACRPLILRVRSVSTYTHADLTKQLLEINEGVQEDAQRELRWMTEEIGRIGRVSADELEPKLERMVRERAQGTPLQYVLGNQPFGPLLLTVRPPVLIPRPETEEWALHLASLLPSSNTISPIRILDLCTGTGCIPLLLLSVLPPRSATATAVDVLPAACELARENALTVLKEGQTLEVLERDIFAEGFLQEMLGTDGERNPDVLTSNPPYIPKDEMLSLDQSVSGFESHLALAGDVPGSFDVSAIPPALSHLKPLRGLDFYHRIAHLISLGLVRSPPSPTAYPQVVLEVGHDQAAEVSEILLKGTRGRIGRTEVWTDFAGKERCVVGWLKVGT